MAQSYMGIIAPEDFMLANDVFLKSVGDEIALVLEKITIGHGIECIAFGPIIFDENLRKADLPNRCWRERAFQALFYQENISHEAWMATDDAGRRAMLLDAFATAVSRTPRKFMDEAMRDEICRRVRALI